MRIEKLTVGQGERDPAEKPTIAPDFAAIVRSERLPPLLGHIQSLGGTVLGAVADGELRGYATLVPSSALRSERWENLPDTFELGSIEVARSWRGRGLGSSLLEAVSDAIPIEALVMFARGMISHWDLMASDVTPLAHRRRLLRMLGKIGFQRWDTDDPEVSDHPLNFLALRPGRDAPPASVVTFTEALYGGVEKSQHRLDLGFGKS